jgi:fumarate reductase subunit D
MTIASETFRASRRKPGFLAAALHRLSGVALAVFLPLHFLTLGSALAGADRFESVLALTRNPWVKAAEWGLVSALALHMALGLRVLAIEFWGFRERTAVTVSAACAFSFVAGLIFLMSAS